MIWTMTQVALGGALGATGRYLSVVAVIRFFGHGFPLATLLVNIIGSFLMGCIVITLMEKQSLHFAPFLTFGVLGGFTTFSSFSLDTIGLFERGEIATAGFYVVASVALSVGSAFLGMTLTRGFYS